jgi:hypothetical protein
MKQPENQIINYSEFQYLLMMKTISKNLTQIKSKDFLVIVFGCKFTPQKNKTPKGNPKLDTTKKTGIQRSKRSLSKCSNSNPSNIKILSNNIR